MVPAVETTEAAEQKLIRAPRRRKRDRDHETANYVTAAPEPRRYCFSAHCLTGRRFLLDASGERQHAT